MRWALVRVVLAVTSMVVIAFAVPLGMVVKEMARDRAFTDAERQASAVGPALAITTGREALGRAVASTQAGAEGRLAVHVPAPPHRTAATDGKRAAQDAVRIGRQRVTGAQLHRVRESGSSMRFTVGGGFGLLQPTAMAGGQIAVVEVFVPDEDVTNGVTTSWAVLALVALGLVAGSVAVADRFGARTVRPAERLARAARELGRGKLGVRVQEGGPAELRAAAVAFNAMADQVVELLAKEREMAADLSHRLRTPLTVLRLNAASLGEGDAADQTREAVATLESEVDRIIRTARGRRSSVTGASAGCDAAEVVRERMEFWSALAEDEGREARVAGADVPVRVPVARTDLATALDAMLGNVFRHTPEGTAFSVDLHNGGSATNSVIVLVSDAGPGIDDPDTALTRGSGDGGPGSTGLGLDIVRRVAESTGGDVRIGRSVLGGTEIRMWLALDHSEDGHVRRGHRMRRRAHRS